MEGLLARPMYLDPLEEIDAAEIHVPSSWFAPMWLELGFAEANGGGSPFFAMWVVGAEKPSN